MDPRGKTPNPKAELSRASPGELNPSLIKKLSRIAGLPYLHRLYGVKQNKAGAGSNDSKIEKEQKREAMYRKYPMHRFSFCSFGN